MINRKIPGVTIHIRKYREAAGMNMSELARRMRVSLPTVFRWESGEAYPSASRIPELAAELGCSIDELYGRDPPGRDSA